MVFMACLAFRQSLAGVKRVVELDGKFSNRAKGEDKPDKTTRSTAEFAPTTFAKLGLIWPSLA